MLKSLEDVFQRRSVFTKLTLKKRLLVLKHKRNEKLEDHFQNFDKLIRELEGVGSKIEEEDKVCHLLLTLNEDFEAVITAIETMNSKVTMDFVKSRLLDEELKLKTKQGHINNQSEASFRASPLTCYKCGKTGHKFAECRQNSNSMYRGNSRGHRGGARGYYQNNRGQNRQQNHSNSQANSQVNVADEISFIALSTTSTKDVGSFILDSGCTQHMVMGEVEKYMSNITQLKSEVKIGTAKNNEILYAKKKGIIKGICQNREITLEALIVGGMTFNLLSVSKLLKKDFKVMFGNDKSGEKYAVISKNNLIFNCNSYNDLFYLNIDFKPDNFAYNLIKKDEHCYTAKDNVDKDIWHKRLGHVNRYSLKQLGLPYSNEICKSCVEGKSTRKPFYRCEKKTARIGELIHSDIAGPIATPTHEGYKYFQVLIDDYSHFVIVKLLRNKNEAQQNLIDFIKLIKTKHNLKTQRIRLDNGGEFVSSHFKSFCRNKGIELEYTMSHTPQENGTSERMNRTLLDKTRTKFAETNLPRELWGEAVQCSAYELNRSPTEANNGETPATRWYKKNDLTKLRVFGSQAWAVILPKENKLERRAQPCIMVGYTGAGYRLWNYEKNEIICSRDVKFNENQIDYDEIVNKLNKQIIIKNEEELDLERKEENDAETKIEEEERAKDKENTNAQKTKQGRKINVPKYLSDYEVYTAYCLISSDKSDPEEYEKAIECKEWKAAIQKELNSLETLKTWSEAQLPEGKKAIQTRWVFRTKEDGTKKARLVAKGFQLQDENPFEPNYSPVARMSTIRLMLSMALQNDFEVRQLDVPTAFLNGKLESEIYIYAPEGLNTKSTILKLNRALYGLKESPKVWNNTFNEFAMKNNFERSKHDCCLYVNKKVWILIYVDDMLVIGNDEDAVKLLTQYFQAKDLGEVNNFLGMNIKRSKEMIAINQTKFIEKLLDKFQMKECKGKDTPMEKGFQYNPQSNTVNVPFRELIGSLMYISTTTRPDITFSVSYLSRFLDKPTEETWIAGKRILRYLQRTNELELTYYKSNNSNLQLEGYSDANWATDVNDRKSVSGCLILCGGNPVAWFSKKQSCVALSTAEYVAAAACAQDLMNLKGLLNDLKIKNNTVLYCDNKSSILMSKSNENSKRAKHIDIKNHFLRDLVSKEEIKIDYVSTDQNLADMLTKPLVKDTFINLRNKIHIL